MSPLTLISHFIHGQEYPDHDTHLHVFLLLLSVFARLAWQQPASQSLKGLFDHLVAWVGMAAAYMYYLRKQASHSLETQREWKQALGKGLEQPHCKKLALGTGPHEGRGWKPLVLVSSWSRQLTVIFRQSCLFHHSPAMV